MTSVYPTAILTTSDIPTASPSATLAASNHTSIHNNLRDEVIAVETVLGTTGSAVSTSVNYKLANVTGGDRAIGASQTVTTTNKTLGTGTKIALGSDATGDIYYNSGSTVLTRLGIGAVNQILRVVGGLPTWSNESSVAVDLAAPIGHVVDWLTNSAPTNWLLCDGSAVSRTTYATLFGVLGTTYGTGDGSTTFNLPNIKGRVTVGRDSGQTEFDTLGETGGAKTHTLTAAEIPSHTHDVGIDISTGGGGAFVTVAGLITSGTKTYTTDGGTGGGGSHNNLQPYIVLNKIVRAL